MIISDTILKQIKSFGALQYSIPDIISLLALTSEEGKQLTVEFNNHDSLVYRTYKQGEAVGIYNIDAALIKKCEQGDSSSIEQRDTMLKDRRIQNLKRDLFGV